MAAAPAWGGVRVGQGGPSCTQGVRGGHWGDPGGQAGGGGICPSFSSVASGNPLPESYAPPSLAGLLPGRHSGILDNYGAEITPGVCTWLS